MMCCVKSRALQCEQGIHLLPLPLPVQCLPLNRCACPPPAFACLPAFLPAFLPACLQLAEFNPLDADSFASVIKRGARVVLVVGDQVGGWVGWGDRATVLVQRTTSSRL